MPNKSIKITKKFDSLPGEGYILVIMEVEIC